MVSTHLKNISQNGNLPQFSGWKKNHIWNHHLVIVFHSLFYINGLFLDFQKKIETPLSFKIPSEKTPTKPTATRLHRVRELQQKTRLPNRRVSNDNVPSATFLDFFAMQNKKEKNIIPIPRLPNGHLVFWRYLDPKNIPKTHIIHVLHIYLPWAPKTYIFRRFLW